MKTVPLLEDVWIKQTCKWWRLEITRFKRYNNFLRPLEGKTHSRRCVWTGEETANKQKELPPSQRHHLVIFNFAEFRKTFMFNICDNCK